MTQQATIPAVHREITLELPRERAFAAFTEGMASWWPRDSHHITETPAEAGMEPWEGGRCFNRVLRTGEESDWGRVLVWDPPSRLVFAWMLTHEWGYQPDPEKASEVEVRFTDAGDGRTLVALEHRGFERELGGGAPMADQVGGDGGWGMLLGLYAEGAGQAAP
jgi:uncharacterized protein YndB with AHSA1/START domain